MGPVPRRTIEQTAGLCADNRVGGDDLDRRIVDMLQTNARIPNLQIARALGVSEKTVRLRIARLVSEQNLRFVATLDEDVTRTRMFFLLDTEPQERFRLAQLFSEMPQVNRVHVTTGASELVLECSFDSDGDALSFYVNEVEGADNVRQARLIHVIETLTDQTTSIRSQVDKLVDRFAATAERVVALPELLDSACDTAIELLGTHRVVAVLISTASNHLPTMTRWRGMSSRYIDLISEPQHYARGIVHRLMETGQHLFVPDAQSDPLFEGIADIVQAEGFRSFLAVPIRRDDQVSGCLVGYFDHRITRPELQVAVAQELADIVSGQLARVAPISQPRP